VRLAVAAPHEAGVVESVCKAAQMGMVDPVLLGDPEQIRDVARAVGVDISGFPLHEVKDPEQAVHRAVEMIGNREADTLMKGLVRTKAVLRKVLDPHLGVRGDGILSHVAVFQPPKMNRMLMLTDSGMNIAPNFSRKLQIVRNAVAVARRLGVKRPRVAMIAATETLDLPAMPATLDAKIVERISRSANLQDAIVQGPLALDNAVSEELAAVKGIDGDVAGKADILCVPDIETGNVLYKSLTCFAGLDMASALVGAKAPIVLTSRSDTQQTKLLSIALTSLLARPEDE